MGIWPSGEVQVLFGIHVFTSWLQLSASADPAWRRWWLAWLYSCLSCGRPAWISQFPPVVSAQCLPLWVFGKWTSKLELTLFVSTFQVNKNVRAECGASMLYWCGCGVGFVLGWASLSSWLLAPHFSLAQPQPKNTWEKWKLKKKKKNWLNYFGKLQRFLTKPEVWHGPLVPLPGCNPKEMKSVNKRGACTPTCICSTNHNSQNIEWYRAATG